MNNDLLEKLKLEYKEWAKWRYSTNNELLELTDIKFENQTFDNFNFQNINLKNVQFINCELKSTVFTKLKLENVLFDNSTLDKATFNNIEAIRLNLKDSKGNNVNFTNSTFSSSDLFTNEILNKNFSGSEFLNIDLSHKKATSISFSRLKIDKQSKQFAKKNPNITIGLNGIYNKLNNSASLQNEKPKGDEMLGGNEEVILASLTKSKRSFAVSVSTTLITFSIKFIGINSFAYLGLKINPNTFPIIALPIIFFSLYKSNLILNDAIQSIKYVQSQTGAMKVGKFPWLVSRFWGTTEKQKIESFIIRLIYCFHPLILIPLMKNWSSIDGIKNTIFELNISENLCDLYSQNAILFLIIFWVLFFLCLFLSFRMFLKSQNLQKPLLFDLQNPVTDSSDLYKLTKSIEDIKKVLSDFLGNNNSNFSSLDWMNIRNYIQNKKMISDAELRELNSKKK